VVAAEVRKLARQHSCRTLGHWCWTVNIHRCTRSWRYRRILYHKITNAGWRRQILRRICAGGPG
jgi:hypothetical protein